MIIFNITNKIAKYLQNLQKLGKTTGFVPTMGALHQGHLSLIRQAQQANDVVICSIFVNPTQFNDPADLDKYPRPIAEDIKKLEDAGCDVLFNPVITEIYAGNEQWHLAIGELEHLLEGKFRPGHYQGVTQVVYKLFNIVKPDRAYFGQKDYQQFLVISKMTELLGMPVELVMCPIEREPDGLAMSSRNIHLTAVDRQHSLILSKILTWVKEHFDRKNIANLKAQAKKQIGAEFGVKLEYFEIADADSLHPANQNTARFVALVAVKVGNTRLIDNMVIGS